MMQYFVRNESATNRRELHFTLWQTDGTTPATGITGTGFLRKPGGTRYASPAIVETHATDLPGDYHVPLAQSDLDTHGIGQFQFKAAAGNLKGPVLFLVGDFNPYDAAALGMTGPIDTNLVAWLGATPAVLTGGLLQAIIGDATSIRDALLSRILTLTSYPVGSVGRRLHQMDLTLDEGTVQAGTTDSITLATTAPGDLRLVGGLIDTTSGTGAFQSRLITSYDVVSHKATIAPAWAIIPDATTTYRVSSHSQTIALSAQGTAVTLALTASDTAIANRALRRLGQPPVTALDGATPTSAVLRDLYPGTRDALIADTKPRFARDRANLAEDAVYAALTTKIGFTHRYPVPADYLAPVGLGPEEAPLEGPYVEEGGAILTDVGAPLPLRYVKRITDASKFSAEFVDVFALFLAAEACYPITNSNTRTTDLRAEGEQRRAWLRHAESVKATSPKRGDEDSLTRNRGG